MTVPSWTCGAGPESLAGSDVHVWRISLAADRLRIRDMEALLPLEERRSTDALHFERDRSSFCVSRGFLRMLLGTYVGVRPEEVRLRQGGRGKLFLDERFHASDIEFNVSHSAAVALIAVARGRHVGVDIEKIRPEARIEEIAGSFFSPEEARAIIAREGGSRVASFFASWTRKEAVIKAIGQSIMELSADVVVSTDVEAPARIVRVPREHGGPDGWRLRDIPADEGYAAAVCFSGPPAALRLWAPPAWDRGSDG